MKRAFHIFAVVTAVLLAYALYQALVVAPTEQTMGDVQRIFYYHVPSAWTAFLLFFFNFIASIQYLNAGDATQRFGTNHTGGALIVTSKLLGSVSPSAQFRVTGVTNV